MTERQTRLAYGRSTGRKRKDIMEKLIEYLVNANLLQDSRKREYVEAVSRNKALMDVFTIMQRSLFISHAQK